MTVIRQVGDYTVTTDGYQVYLNGQVAVLHTAPKDTALKYVIDTGTRGANGKPNLVGLTAEQYAIHTKACAEHDAATELADGGASVIEMSTHSGHQTVQMARRYARPTEKQFESAAAKRIAGRNKP